MPTARTVTDNPTPRRLFGAFLRLGLTAFGGPAMVAYMRDLAVTRHGWLDQATFRDGVAVCQAVPGATAMQTAAFVGLRCGGLLGGLAAYVGFGLPAFGLMMLLAWLYQRGHDLPAAVAMLGGLRVVVVAIIANAAFTFGRATLHRGRDAGLMVVAAAAYLLSASPVLVIVGAALCGRLLWADEPVANAGGLGPWGTGLARWAGWMLALSALALAVLYGVDRQLGVLAATLARIDLLAFGGGFAAVPLMQHEVVAVRGWMSAPAFIDGIALGQVTPGPIVITATFVGYAVRGVAGALVATVAAFAPSFIVLTAALSCYRRWQGHVAFQAVLRGILVAFVGLLVSVAVRFGAATAWSPPAVALAVAALVALRRGMAVPWVVLAGALTGVLSLTRPA